MSAFAILAAGLALAGGGAAPPANDVVAQRGGAIVVLDQAAPVPRTLFEAPLGSHRGAYDPTPSPDGRTIAFAYTPPADDDAHGTGLRALDLATGALRTLTSSARFDGYPAWSPDGTRVAFSRTLSRTDVRSAIMVLTLADRTVRQLTTPPRGASDLEAAWSPDGTTLAFVRSTVGAAGDPDLAVVTVPADGGVERRLSPTPGRDADPAWSPDGTLLAIWSEVDGNRDVYVMRADGTDRRRITTDPTNDRLPAWSPAGHRLLWTREPAEFAFILPSQLMVANADGSCARPLTRDAGGVYDGRFAPGAADAPLTCGPSDPPAPVPASTAAFDRAESELDAAAARASHRALWWLGEHDPRFALASIHRGDGVIRFEYRCRLDAACRGHLSVDITRACGTPFVDRGLRLRGVPARRTRDLTTLRTGGADVRIYGLPVDQAWALGRLRGASRPVLAVGPGERLPAPRRCPPETTLKAAPADDIVAVRRGAR